MERILNLESEDLGSNSYVYLDVLGNIISFPCSTVFSLVGKNPMDSKINYNS